MKHCVNLAGKSKQSARTTAREHILCRTSTKSRQCKNGSNTGSVPLSGQSASSLVQHFPAAESNWRHQALQNWLTLMQHIYTCQETITYVCKWYKIQQISSHTSLHGAAT